MCGRSGGVEDLDESLEGHIGIAERIQIGGPHGGEELAEPGSRIDRGAQRERIDEHADEFIECFCTSTGDRRSDHHVAGAAEPREQYRERGVYDHEHADIVRGREFDDGAVQWRVEGEVEVGAAH